MIDMRVTEDYRVDFAEVEGEGVAVAGLIFIAALHQTAFEQQAFAGRTNQVTGAGDSSGCAEKLNVHIYQEQAKPEANTYTDGEVTEPSISVSTGEVQWRSNPGRSCNESLP